MTDYPPEPWRLCGRGYISLWLVPSRVLPPLPAGVRPVSVLGRTAVATALVDYQPGGVLAYHELLACALVREGPRPGLSITDIWVDSPASRAGGRELWGIPKELADFELTHERGARAAVRRDGVELAAARVRPGRLGVRLPFPLRGTVLQTLDGAVARTPVSASGRLRLATGAWRFGPELAWLRPFRPVLTVATTDFVLRFGPRSTATVRR
jgi:hypothetical protein